MYKCLNPGAVGVKIGWEECLPLARENGFSGIDLAIDPAVPTSFYRDALQKNGLKPGGMGLPVRADDDETTYGQKIDPLTDLAKRAQEIGVSRFNTWIKSFSDELDWDDNFRLHVDRLGAAASILADHGCRLGLEFLGPKTLRDGHRYEFVHTMEQMLELAAAVGPNVGLLLDAWHWHTSASTVEALRTLKNSDVVYVHVNDAPAGVAMDEYQDLVRRLPGDTGVIDMRQFMATLAEIGYDGPVVPEPFVPALGEMSPDDALKAVGEAMNRIWTF